ncbi:dihydropteroate synthase [Roseomonas gilardii subsp. gilardii]|uniref:dihydropteroate synthase n=1 Tax=Roseomonas gilardii TaxID=257708 RepID=UPI001FFA194A|nr:dihydropteroate synthase [Roseomonas gilardii]UPG71882.1 dihydropteroate synthase [Roseomonas gilardii subsp. gilardii]
MVERWLEPLGLLRGKVAEAALAAGHAAALRGEGLAFTLARLIEAGREAGLCPVTALPEDWRPLLADLARPLPAFAGLERQEGRPLVMGILNVTPDSFSDGGRYLDQKAAVAAGHAMLEAGADLLDLGGESTRPGAAPVTPEEEIARVVPVIRALAPQARISVDTRHAATMRAAIAAGAHVVNDVAALRGEGALEAVADSDCAVVLMHMPGLDPATMQSRADYPDVALAVQRFLAERIAACEAAGIARSRLCVDPGIGFGKTVAHNLELIDRLPLLHGLGCRVLMAASRKGFIGRLGREPVAERRVPGSLAVALAAAARGAGMVRVHDVAETVQALRLGCAIAAA